MSLAPGASGDAQPLRLDVAFSRTDTRSGEEIECSVRAERAGFRGYGMMLAEIGLPPGADVSRESLDAAVSASQWSVSAYDVLPDRVVVYLWPRAAGVEFKFRFRPRFGMAARSAPSVLYDYYNPDARAVVPPALFHVAEAPPAARREKSGAH